MSGIKPYSLDFFIRTPLELPNLEKGYLLRRDVTELVDKMGKESTISITKNEEGKPIWTVNNPQASPSSSLPFPSG